MPNTVTPVLGLVKPEINGAQTENVWGYDINANFDIIDARIGTLTVGEAPNDGILYGRLNVGWVPAAPLNSPALTGTPTAPTPAPDDNDTSLATTAFVQAAAALKAPLASPAFTGNPTAPTPVPGDNDTSIATTAFVTAFGIAAGAVAPSNVAPQAPGVANAGTSALYSRGDHAHPADPTRVAKAGDTMSGTLTAPSYSLTLGGGLQNVSGANLYTALQDGSNGNVFLGGGTAAPFNFYRNTEHIFQSRDFSVTFGTFNATGLQIGPTTASTSPTTGALRVAGGAGIAGNGYFGGTLNCTGALSVGGSISLPAGSVINFGGQTYLYGNNNATIALSNAYHFYNFAGSALYMSMTAAGMSVNYTAVSSSPSTGALVVAGGVGVGGALNVAGNIQCYGGSLLLRGWGGDPNASVIFFNANQSIYLYQTGGALTFVGVPIQANNGLSVLNGTVLQVHGPSSTEAARLFHDNSYSWLQSPRNWVMGGLGGGPASTIFQGPAATSSLNGTVVCQGGMGVSGSLFTNLSAHVSGSTPSWQLQDPGLGVKYTGGSQYGINIRPVYDDAGSYGIVFVNGAGNATVGYVLQTPVTVNYVSASDARMKEDLEPIDSGPMIDAIEAKAFRWKANGERGYGVMAQEAAKVMPEACHYNEKFDQWGTDYSKFVPILLAEMKALRARVAELEGRA